MAEDENSQHTQKQKVQESEDETCGVYPKRCCFSLSCQASETCQ